MAITINGNGTITGVSAGGLPDGSVDADTLASTLDISGKTLTLPSSVGQYIQSQRTAVNPTNNMTGDQNHVDVTFSGGSGLILDMGVPNSTTSTFILHGDAQVYLDSNTSVDSGAYCGIGFMRKIGTGSWTIIRDQGRWGQGNSNNDDNNIRAQLVMRDYPNTTSNVYYKLVFSTHRGGSYWGRVPSGQEGGTTNLYVIEYDAGESY